MITVEYDNYDCQPSGNVCPHCLRVNGEAEGSATEHEDPKNVVFTCGYCNEKYLLRFIIDPENPSEYLPEKMKEYFRTGKLRLF